MAPVPPAPEPAPDAVWIVDGVCHVCFAFDVGLSIRLDLAQQLLGAGGSRGAARQRRGTPEHFGFLKPPLRLTHPGAPLEIGAFAASADVECVVFEFGAVSLRYSIPLTPAGAASLEDLRALSDLLYANAALLADARGRIAALAQQLQPAVTKPAVSRIVEDYAIFHLRRLEGERSNPEVLLSRPGLVAGILRGEPERLSAQEADEALQCRISYTPDDLTLIDWNGAIVVGPDMDDVLAVLEYANIELLELRYLDNELDHALERSHARPRVKLLRRLFHLDPPATMRFIAEMQVDAATLFEEVNNSLKLLGDQYLARVYRLASQRMHLTEWDTGILRKLDTLETIYDRLNDFETSRRLEVLEWMVIILIAFEVVMSLVRH